MCRAFSLSVPALDLPQDCVRREIGTEMFLSKLSELGFWGLNRILNNTQLRGKNTKLFNNNHSVFELLHHLTLRAVLLSGENTLRQTHLHLRELVCLLQTE